MYTATFTLSLHTHKEATLNNVSLINLIQIYYPQYRFIPSNILPSVTVDIVNVINFRQLSSLKYFNLTSHKNRMQDVDTEFFFALKYPIELSEQSDSQIIRIEFSRAL